MSKRKDPNQTSGINNMKIALIGKTGCGKSATANTILGRKEFESQSSSTSITVKCKKAKTRADGPRVTVVDTPGLFDNALSNEEVTEELKKCIYLLAPGPHVFLMVLQIGRFTPEEKDAVKLIKEAFGRGAEEYILLLFTRGDDLEEDGRSIEDYIQKADPELQQLISDCGNRFHVFNNREKKDRTQVEELLEKIDDMVQENGGSHYTNEMLKKAEKDIQEEKDRIMKEKDEEIRKEKEEMERKYQQQLDSMKQQGESMKEFILQLQQDHAKQTQVMMEKYEDQARRQAEESRFMANAARAEAVDMRKDAELAIMKAQLAMQRDSCVIS